MGATAIIVFREILEIALVLGILLAATRGLEGRSRWFLLGIGGGILGAVAIAASADAISNSLEGVGQEVFNAVVLFTAVVMLGWTVVWMKKHGRQLSQHLRVVGESVARGDAPMLTLASVIALSVFREGAEVVLFTYGILSAQQATLLQVLTGGAIGLLGGVAVGTLLYLGLLRVARRHVFAVTSWLLVLLAAGMAAGGARFLIAAGYLPELQPQVWDTSHILSEQSLVGGMLHVMIGYIDRPSGMELVFYVGAIVLIGGLLSLASRPGTPRTVTA